MARAALLSAVDRSLDRRRTVVLDTQNNIKGYRYQLWCIARTVRVQGAERWERQGAQGAQARRRRGALAGA